MRGLAREMPRRRIVSIVKGRKKLRRPFPSGLASLVGRRVVSLARRAKYILIGFENGQTLIIHLGMSGRMTISKEYIPQKHDHMVMTLDNGAVIVFNDPRRFGLVVLAKTTDLAAHALFCRLGPEPLEKEFTAAYLAAQFHGKKTAVKVALMDQRIVVGVGNIYASEALFYARIDPRRAAKSLTAAELKKLVSFVVRVLRTAIKAGGSSLKDYVQADGELGYFQHSFAVYGREGLRCRGCSCSLQKTGGVKRIAQGGRSTFYCPEKQK